MRAAVVLALMTLTACGAAAEALPPPASGLVALPCDGKGPLRPHTRGYCAARYDDHLHVDFL